MEDNADIIISTFFGSPNYGTNIQAVSLSHTLNRMGYNVYMLGDIRIVSYLVRHPTLLFARVYNRINSNKRKDFFEPSPYVISDDRLRRIRKFKCDNFRVVSILNTKQWNNIIMKKTVFVAGSDIIWNPALGYPARHFLDYAYFAGLPRFSYGSSVGAKSLSKSYYRAYRRYLGSMVDVGVREQSVADEVSNIIDRKVTKVVDPSLLMTANDWDMFAKKAELSVNINDDGFILCYFVMEDRRYWDYIRQVKRATGKQIIVLPMHEADEKQPYDIIFDGTMYEFIWLIKNAEFICTDSFHACAISLIYQKEFYLLRRERRDEDAKYKDFLNRYYLLDRLVFNEKSFEYKPRTNYEEAIKQLEKDRLFSLHFLECTLQKCI